MGSLSPLVGMVATLTLTIEAVASSLAAAVQFSLFVLYHVAVVQHLQNSASIELLGGMFDTLCKRFHVGDFGVSLLLNPKRG